ncbi:hypothetical protein HOLleu_32016 [Holothuria leucospilota]|uniref:Uncharacterized protein n=1 Tax=Holothuria leucospilota TaxID=206669 RepID=A0A9Q0YQV2_HOLLE|nr:hypothetical protein HOLleu_32016 [Holothuria leucospilota]
MQILHWKKNYYDLPRQSVTQRLICQVVDIKAQPILGADAYKSFALMQRINHINDDTSDDILEKFRDVFIGLGCLPDLHKITVNRYHR